MKKKIVIAIMLIIYLFCNVSSLATSETKSEKKESLTDALTTASPHTKEDAESLWNSGESNTYGKKTQKNLLIQTQSNTNMFFLDKLVCMALMAIPWVSNNVLSQITSDGKENYTIYKVITNHYDLFNLSHLVKKDNVNPSVDNIIVPITSNVAIWFIGIRNLAIVASVIMIIYVALRMAIATIATKKANYKKMLFGWIEGILLLLVLHIFVILMIFVSNWMVGVLTDASEIDPDVPALEERMMTNISDNLEEAHDSYGVIFYTILYVVFSYYRFKFFLLYMGRLLRTGFYIIISPLVCVTIPIDKVGDEKAQSFGNWILEFCITTFMQPMHLLIYIVTIYSIGEILVRSPILGIAFLIAMSYAEKTFKSILKLKPTLGKGLKDIKLKPLVEGEE